jgi:hypothetical protein
MKYNFSIVTQPRSGDEILISKLRSHPNIYITLGKPYNEFLTQTDYSVFDEYLLTYKYNKQNYDLKYNEQDITHSLNTKDYMQTYYNEQIKIGCIHENERQKIENYLDLIYSRDKEKKKEGYKIATECALQRYKKAGITIYGEHFLQNYHENILSSDHIHIVLFRKNLLWQYTSSLLPVEVNEHGYTKIIDTKFNIDSIQFECFVKNTLDEREQILKRIHDNGTPYIVIYYEDLVKNGRATLDTVQQFLNVPIQERDLYGINTDNIFEETRPIDVIIKNYTELKEEFTANEHIAKYFKMAEESVNPFYYELRKAGTFKSLEFLREMYDGKP